MKAYDLLHQFRTLTPVQQDYAIQWLTGAFDCVATGFTQPHVDSDKAKWAINELETAIKESRKK